MNHLRLTVNVCVVALSLNHMSVCIYCSEGWKDTAEIWNENNVPDMASNPPHKSKGKGENMQIKFGKPQVVTYSLVRLDNLVCHAFWWVLNFGGFREPKYGALWSKF